MLLLMKKSQKYDNEFNFKINESEKEFSYK